MDKFPFKREYIDILDDANNVVPLTDSDRLEWLMAIIRYALDNKEPQFKNDCLKLVWRACIEGSANRLRRANDYNTKKKMREKGITAESVSDGFVDKVMDLWNSTCVPALPRLRDIKGSRRNKLALRMEEACEDKSEEERLQWCKELFEKIAKTPFLHGENSHRWKATFDWFVLNDTNWRRTMEGVYDEENTNLAEKDSAFWTKGI